MLRLKQFNASFSKYKCSEYKWCCTLIAVHHNLRYDGYANTKKQALHNAYNSYVNVRAYNVRPVNSDCRVIKQYLSLK